MEPQCLNRLKGQHHSHGVGQRIGLLDRATGKGNADKDMMYEAFVKETNIDLKQIFDTEKVGNPISDIADSYFIQKVGYENSNSN